MGKSQSVLADKEKLLEGLKETGSVAGLLRHFGLRTAGGNFNTARKWLEYHGIPVPNPDQKARATSGWKQQKDNFNPFYEGSHHRRSVLKNTLLHQGHVEYICDEYGIGSEYNGKKLTLQLDHINGVHNDNRLENLRLLCPNCHSQTHTYAGRNVKH